jgi:hypothetical protein
VLTRLVADGRAAWIGDPVPVPRVGAERHDDTAAAALAVAGLFTR